MSFSPPQKQPDHVALEHRVLERWRQQRTFSTLCERNREGVRGDAPGGPGRERFSFIDGPITANNPMGVHHAWGRTLKDVWQRYHALLGKDLRYQNGFDCQGLWVEVEVEKALGLNSKPEIEQYGLGRFARACRDRVAKYAAVQTAQSIRLGQWMDWDRSYFTMTDVNISSIWGFLAECYDRGWLYQGYRSMPWCPRCGTSLSQHELADSYSTLTHPSLYVRFPLVDRAHEHLVVWTTTPWTLTANVAAALDPEASFAKVETLAGIAYVAVARLEHSPVEGKVVGTVLGADLVGLRYAGPFDDLPAQRGVEHRVVAWKEATGDEGTGIVHIAPGCGEEDYELGREEGLAVIVPVDEAGRFTDAFGWLHGLQTAEAAPMIVDDLGRRGRLVEAGEISHRYPVCWRCGQELIFRLVEEWFIDCDELRQPMIEAARTVEWTPPQYGKRMEDWLRNMGDWCISRRRYWGLPLPFWYCDDGHLTIVGSKKELLSKALSGVEQLEELHRPWIDAVTIPCATCGKVATRTTDVGDCWLDAGIVPFSTLGWRNDTWIEAGYAEGAGVGVTKADLPDHVYWQTWFPADWVSEMREQIRLWFYSLLFMSVTLTGRAPYRRVLTYEKVNDETGRPMHKSWGNAIWFDEAVESMGADIMRWLYAAQPPAQNLNFGYGPANDVRRRFLTLWNTYSFLVRYALIDGWAPQLSVLESGPDLSAARPLDRWMVARTQQLIAECRAGLDEFCSPRLVRAAEAFVEDLSNWYVRRSRDRFWGSHGADKQVAYETCWYALVQLARCLAPVTPFLADELWERLVVDVCAGAEPSVHLAGYPIVDPALLDEAVLAEMAAVREVVVAGRAARDQAQIKTRQPLAALIVATADAGRRARLQVHADLVTAELSVKELRLVTSSEDFAQTEAVPNFRVLGPRYGPDVQHIQRLLRAGDYEHDGDRLKVGCEGAGGTPPRSWTLEPGEFEVRTRAREGFAVAGGDGFAVALEVTITPELAVEGAARDLIRAVQELRKQADLELTDRIRITYPPSDRDTFAALGDWIRHETLADAADEGPELAINRPS
ncbi:MAG: isoleucine--tRNA ligase [Egibacteraceae bacterium]